MKSEKIIPFENMNQSVNLTEKTMEEKKSKQDEMIRDAASGTMGGIIGGAVGAAVGSFIAQEANAQESVQVSEAEQEHIPEPAKPEPVVTTPEPEPTPEPVVTTPEPEPTPEPEVQVIGYEQVPAGDGQVIQVAAVSINGNVVQLAEVTGDDIVDLAGMDSNYDGQITEDEIIDVSAEGISMQQLHDSYQQTQNLAQDTDISSPDYINDGNVDDFIA